MKQLLLEQSVIHADETVVQVLKEDGKAATSESRMWVYASGERSRKPIRILLRLLGTHEAEIAGSHAAGSNCKDR